MASKGKQVENGKAFEYAIAEQYYLKLKNRTNVRIVHNAALKTAQHYFNGLKDAEKARFREAAVQTIDTLIRIEPGLTNSRDSNDVLYISLQEDAKGMSGDVRDVVFSRPAKKWEIGFSAKNNNDAVKHSRLSNQIDFGKLWLGVPCSHTYWTNVNPIFKYLEECVKRNMNWKDLRHNKFNKVYIPLLKAFRNETLNIAGNNQSVPQKLVEYLIGNKPFYKIIKDDAHNLVVIKAFNINGGLGKDYAGIRSSYKTPRIHLPCRIVEFEFNERSNNTLNMILDKGWEISFRIHNASKAVEKSLKFDIQLLGNPPVLFTQHLFQ